MFAWLTKKDKPVAHARPTVDSMRPALANLRVGPFKSRYHAAVATSQFRSALTTFLEQRLLPQVELPFESAEGSLTAVYDDDKNCGPNSLVRNIYLFEFAFHRPEGDDTIRIELVFDPEKQAFSVRRNKAFYLWTVSRREKELAEGRTIQALCQRISKNESVDAICPLCASALVVHDSPSLFDVRCPQRCFNYNFHRDPKDGQFLHGHFFRKEPSDAE